MRHYLWRIWSHYDTGVEPSSPPKLKRNSPPGNSQPIPSADVRMPSVGDQFNVGYAHRQR